MQDLALKSYYVFRKPELITQALANADWQQLAFRFRVSLLSWHCVHLFTQQSCYGWLYIKQTLNLHFVGGLKELLNTVSTPAACQSLQDIKAGSFSRLKDEMLVFHSGSRWAPNTAQSEGGQKTVRCFLRRHGQGTVSEKHNKHKRKMLFHIIKNSPFPLVFNHLGTRFTSTTRPSRPPFFHGGPKRTNQRWALDRQPQFSLAHGESSLRRLVFSSFKWDKALFRLRCHGTKADVTL